MTDIDPILGIIDPETLAHIHTVNAAGCDSCPTLENREHDIAYLEAEIIRLKDENAGLNDQILSLEHQLREAKR